jgi:hypothetical protein
LQKQKQYFVKYKGLAHVHNRWLPENQLLLEAPWLVAKFNQKNQVPELLDIVLVNCWCFTCLIIK